MHHHNHRWERQAVSYSRAPPYTQLHDAITPRCHRLRWRECHANRIARFHDEAIATSKWNKHHDRNQCASGACNRQRIGNGMHAAEGMERRSYLPIMILGWMSNVSRKSSGVPKSLQRVFAYVQWYTGVDPIYLRTLFISLFHFPFLSKHLHRIQYLPRGRNSLVP